MAELHTCVVCGLLIGTNEVSVGMGDGRGQRFGHQVCYLRTQVSQLEGKVKDHEALYVRLDVMAETVDSLRAENQRLREANKNANAIIGQNADEMRRTVEPLREECARLKLEIGVEEHAAKTAEAERDTALMELALMREALIFADAGTMIIEGAREHDKNNLLALQKAVREALAHSPDSLKRLEGMRAVVEAAQEYCHKRQQKDLERLIAALDRLKQEGK